MKFFLLILIFASVIYVESKPLPQAQPGCDFAAFTMIFYENHRYYVKDQPDKNWICHEPYRKLLKYCFFFYKHMCGSKFVQTRLNITGEESVDKECKRHKLTFWQPASSAEEDQYASNVTLDVRMFHCPITRMDLQFPRGDKPYEILDFYLAEGRNDETVSVLYNSTNSDNICLTDMFKPGRNFIRQYFGTNRDMLNTPDSEETSRDVSNTPDSSESSESSEETGS